MCINFSKDIVHLREIYSHELRETDMYSRGGGGNVLQFALLWVKIWSALLLSYSDGAIHFRVLMSGSGYISTNVLQTLLMYDQSDGYVTRFYLGEFLAYLKYEHGMWSYLTNSDFHVFT